MWELRTFRGRSCYRLTNTNYYTSQLRRDRAIYGHYLLRITKPVVFDGCIVIVGAKSTAVVKSTVELGVTQLATVFVLKR